MLYLISNKLITIGFLKKKKKKTKALFKPKSLLKFINCSGHFHHHQQSKMKRIIILTCIVHALFIVTRSENDLSPSISPASDCSDLIFGNNIMDCVPFLSNGSEKTKPEVSCCSGFETVLNTNAECICEAIISSAQMGIYFNVTKTMAMPSTCGMSTPPFQCDSK
jgi:hypothetical protein